MNIEQEVMQYLHDDMGFSIENETLHDIIVALSREDSELVKGDFASLAGSIASRFAVHETYFLRHREQFDWLVDNWLPWFLAGNNKKTVHVLSAGCATGEEPYSVYARLAPLMQAQGVSLVVDAVDICQAALKKAEKARYGLWSMRGVDEEQEKSWLDVHSREIQVKPWVREGVNFYQANITRPFLQHNLAVYDLVLCRNVMIYMHQQAVETVFANLSQLMAENALLVPGPSDPNPDKLAMPMCFDHGVRVFSKDMAVLDSLTEETAAKTVKPLRQKQNRRAEPVEKILADLARMREQDSPQPDPQEKLADEQIYRKVEQLIRDCQYSRARKMLEAHTLVKPMDVKAYVLLAMMAMELDDRQLAAGAVRKAYFLQPESPYVMYLRASYLKTAGDTKNEKKMLTALLDMLSGMPGEQELDYSLGITVEQLTGAVNARLG